MNKSKHSFERNASHPKYRPDIDGIRAVAVLAVVAFHVFPDEFKGGFIGVDIFFVISGFLISSIIYRGMDNNTFSFYDFYSRRIRRIFPSLLCVLAFCIGAGWFILLQDEYRQLGKNLVAGSFFASNFSLLQESGYFNDDAINNPLLHLWSLAIEEQFYILWPLALLLLWKKEKYIPAATILALILSFSLNLHWVSKNQPLSFYSPQSRFWEILFGSLLAWHSIKSEWISSKVGTFIKNKTIITNSASIIGILLITSGFLFISESVKFPGLYALIPTIGATLLILAGPHAWFNKVVLSNKILVWFGVISFPLYLWHWPLISFAHIIESGMPSTGIRMILIAVSIALAWACYYFIEIKIRNGAANLIKTTTLLILMVPVGIMGYFIYSNDGLPLRVEEFTAKSSDYLSQIKTPAYLSNDNCKQIFPKISDNICLLANKKTPDTILFGDSHAMQFYNGLAKIKNSNIGVLGGGWNSAGLNPLIKSISIDDKLYSVQSAIYNYISTDSTIKNVIISCATVVCYDHQKKFKNKLKETLEFFIKKDKNVTFVLDIPSMPFDSKKCLSTRPFNFRENASQQCITTRKFFDDNNKKYRDDVMSVLKNFPSVKVFDPAQYLCDKDYCYAFKNNKFLYMTTGDNSHLSDNGSDFLATSLYQTINRGI